MLVVDDDRNLRKIISTNLELAGYEVATACRRARGARERSKQDVPDLVLLDLMMPHMDGYEVARRVRAHPNPTIANVPIIILTAKGETEDKLRGFEAGADDYITKPFGPRELLARVRAKIRRVEVDSSLSPLTRLPGNLAIERRAAAPASTTTNRSPCSISISTTSRRSTTSMASRTATKRSSSSRASRSTSVRRRGTPNDFVGHIGGDDFIIVTATERAEEIAQEIIDEFDRDIRSLYSRQRSARRATSRRAIVAARSIGFRSCRFRLPSSQTTSTNSTNYAQIGETAAELKRYAKSIAGSVYVKDKRRS